MTASVRNFPVRVSAACCAELRAMKPLADALDEYAATVHAMTDEQLAHEVARVEALPGGYRHLATVEQERRADAAWAALVASMASTRTWGWQA